MAKGVVLSGVLVFLLAGCSIYPPWVDLLEGVIGENKQTLRDDNTQTDTGFTVKRVYDDWYHYGGFYNPVIHNNSVYFGGNGYLYRYRNGVISYIDYVDFNSPVIYDGYVYFYDTYWNELYKIEGDNAILVDEDFSTYITGFNSPIVFKGELFFGGDWEGNRIIRHYAPDSFSQWLDGGFFHSPIIKDGLLVFAINTAIWWYDGVDYNSAYFGGVFNNPILYDGYIYFEGGDGTELEVRKTDRANLYDLDYDDIYYSDFKNPVVFNDSLYFGGRTDAAGNIRIFGLHNNVVFSIESAEYDYWFEFPVVYERSNELIFGGLSGGGADMVVFSYDGNGEIRKIPAHPESGYTHGFSNPVIFRDYIFFQGIGDTGTKPYYYDGEYIRRVNIATDAEYGGGFHSPIVFENNLLFGAMGAYSYISVFVID